MHGPVLLFHTGSIGDTIVTIPGIRAVRAAFPGRQVVVLTNGGTGSPASARAVLEGEGLVDGFIEYVPATSVRGRLAAMSRVAQAVIRARVETAVCLLPSGRPASSLARDRWFLAACGVSRLIGFRMARPEADIARRARVAPNHEAVMKMARLVDEGLESAVGDAPWRLPFLAPSANEQRLADECLSMVSPDQPMLAVALSAGLPSKEWPRERFEALACRAQAARVRVVVVGGPADHAAAAALCARSGGVNACGVSVRATAAILARCRAMVGCDSGMAHVASGMGTSVVVVGWAGLARGAWDPIGDARVLRLDVPCGGCVALACPVPGHPCLDGISVDTVWNALSPLLA